MQGRTHPAATPPRRTSRAERMSARQHHQSLIDLIAPSLECAAVPTPLHSADYSCLDRSMQGASRLNGDAGNHPSESMASGLPVNSYHP